MAISLLAVGDLKKGSRMTEQDRIEAIAANQPNFGRWLGTRILSVTPDRVEAEMTVTEDMLNRNGVLHGGAAMGFADNLGGTATFLNLAEGEGTTTIESKTNFFRAVEPGDTLRGVIVALHKGRSTMVWQTTLTRGDGKVAAIVTQTQMILQKKR